ncbi:MAG: vitamin B12 dependent-methionine synthase activation domain-containing protein, partial [Candidatus Electryoneaceae bacterium]|nr:vitamin B12 dependent-methionine synthase activation domain-containing protein [Candidatus Electryoneaceae bacterium]
FHFPRRTSRGGISATDWIRPADIDGDYVGLFVVTSGVDTSVRAAELRDEGRLLDSLILQALSIELAEATAEWLHQFMRIEWGISDTPETTLADLFHKRYRGVRLSFGYSACPDLEDQQSLFHLLNPERIGVSLMEGLMMEPEGSVSAVVFHHPEGRY